MDPQKYRSRELSKLPAVTGVYALCDLDGIPIYVGKSLRSKNEGIRSRVRRHLTSARSDIVANRQLDVWEVAFVWAWPTANNSHLQRLEAFLFHEYDCLSKLVNGTVPEKVKKLAFKLPDKIEVQVMSDEQISIRKQPPLRFPRQVAQFNQLLDWVLNTKDEVHLRRALEVHFERVRRFYREFSETAAIVHDDSAE